MAERIIVWSETAKLELKDIFEYFNFRNKSKLYSLKLNRIIQTELKSLLHQPEIGKKTDTINVRGLLIENYFIFYEINKIHIIILSVWDTRQNPERLKYIQ
ncbi:MAG: type II toxin-antitoxin system RelE/ParE family toxin [Flavobacterium sp.]|uniref:type II toxin-antitoxin system RelE/ParE family toxin n=1 Tax=Flavobacterium sp. TaxID=239 RepID=UPI00260C22BA|nr:type II toxin-antitoxin system RelE/ParE family toxin [Flavobacterium sp.]MDD5152172.1 type II toxin-antitoxin system RelE/ParE family toxin [Flavobacterium sp.]